MLKSLMTTFLETRRLTVTDADVESLHTLCAAAPSFGLAALHDALVDVSRKSVIFATLIKQSSIDARDLAAAVRSLSDEEFLTVLIGLKTRRVNGRRARQVGLRALLGHERFAELASCHRQRTVEILKHLLGERTWATVCRRLADNAGADDPFLRRNILRFAIHAEPTHEVLLFLAGIGVESSAPKKQPWIVIPWLSKSESPREWTLSPLRRSVAARKSLEAGRGMPLQTLSGIRGTFHPQVAPQTARELAAPRVRVERRDGRLTIEFKEEFAKPASDRSFADVVGNDRTDASAVSIAVVLDLSASAGSSGERTNHPAALGLALLGELQRLVGDLDLFQVGGTSTLDADVLPRPTGATDLATAVLSAAETSPDAILIITDGYENRRQGDTSQVVEGLRRLGVASDVAQVVPLFAAGEDLSRRRLGSNIPLVAVEHESSAGELTARAVLAREPDALSADVIRKLESLIFRGVS